MVTNTRAALRQPVIGYRIRDVDSAQRQEEQRLEGLGKASQRTRDFPGLDGWTGFWTGMNCLDKVSRRR